MNNQNLSQFDPRTTASSSLVQSVALFTPSIAKYILDNRHGKNRPLNKNAVKQYRNDILAGVWNFAADPIRFDTSGNLIDGQHRMAALHMAGQTNPNIALPFSVVLGLDPQAIKTIDQGRKRTAGQQLAISGNVKNYNAIAAGAKFAYLYETEGLTSNSHRRKVSAPIIERWVEQHRDIVEHVNGHHQKLRNTDLPTGAATASALILAQVDADDEERFFTLLSDGGEPQGSPITTLDKTTARLRRRKVYQHPEANIFMVFKAWNAWRKGKTLSRINSMKPDDVFPDLV